METFPTSYLVIQIGAASKREGVRRLGNAQMQEYRGKRKNRNALGGDLSLVSDVFGNPAVAMAISVLLSGCAENGSHEFPEIQGVSAQSRGYLIDGWHYEQDGIGWFTDSEGRLNIDPRCKWERVTNGQ